MPEPLSIIGTTIALWTQVIAIYEKIKYIKNLPKSFRESGTKLAIINKCLEDVKNQLDHVQGEDQEVILAAIKNCQDKGESLKLLFDRIEGQVEGLKKDGNGWAAIKNLYKSTVLSLHKGSKGRVESLVQDVLETLNVLVAREVLQQSTTLRDLQPQLQAAIQELRTAAQAEPTLSEAECTEAPGKNVNIAGNAQGIIAAEHNGNIVTKTGGYHYEGSGTMQIAFNNISDSELQNVTEWLQNMAKFLPFNDTQTKMLDISNKAPGSGEWLIGSPEFRRWRGGQIGKLLCHGDFGTGKTVLMSVVIDHLMHIWRETGNNHACLYVFFDSHREDDQTLPNLLSTLLAQLLGQSQSVSDMVLKVYRDYQTKGIKPSINLYVDMLHSQMVHRSPSTVYFVVDALDQCQDTVLAGFMDAFQKLPPNVQMLCTSVSKEGLKDLRFDENMRIEAHDADVKAFLKKALKGERFAQMMKDGAKSNAQFRQHVLDIFVEKSQKRFLLAALHLETLTHNSDSLGYIEFSKVLNHLSKTPDVFYQEAVKRIKGQSERMWLLAKKVLSWLVFADRALTLEELAYGIDLSQLGRSSFDQFQSSLSRACFGIVIVDKETKIVRLQHISARTYLLKEGTEILPPETYAHSMIAHACLQYICRITPKVDQKGPVSLQALKKRCEKYPFLDYAANHWGRHVSYGVDHDTNLEAWEFLHDKRTLTYTVQVMAKFALRNEADVTGMHVAAYFGLSALVLKANRHGRRVEKDACTRTQESVIHWAVRWHQYEFLEILLLNLRAHAGAQDSRKRTPLHIAVADDDIRSVEVLLKCPPPQRPEIEALDDSGWTVLRYAAAHGSRAMVEKLVAEGARVNDADANGWTALRWAADRDYVRICETLIQSKASMELELPNSERWSLLHWAATNGREKLVRLLIERRVDLSVPDGRQGWAPLRCAVEHGCTMIAWHLLEASAPTQQQDNVGRTSLHAAAENGYLNLLWLLLVKQADPNTPDKKFGRTPLHLAAEKGRASAISLLLENGARIFQTDSNKRTALHWAVQEGHKEAVELLLWRTNGSRELVQMADFEKRTPLHYAAAHGNLDVAKMLHRFGADPASEDCFGHLPLHVAESGDHRALVQYLRQYI